jgi:hypothetical protein
MDSYRAKAYGLLSVTLLLHLMSTFYQQQLPQITIRCDILALVNMVNTTTSRARPEFPNDTRRPSWDILQAICKRFRLHPNLSLRHIEGHQDRNSFHSQLPFPAQLNILADTLATPFQPLSHHALTPGPMILGTGCHLSIEQQTISSYHCRRIRVIRDRHRLLQHIQQKAPDLRQSLLFDRLGESLPSHQNISDNKPNPHR